MLNLYEYLFESTFGNNEFYKHSYAKDLINKLMTTGQVRLGAKGETTYTIPDDIFPSVQKELSEIVDSPDQEKFNEILNKYKLPKFTQMFKGDFSGYVNGLASKNRGNAFEDEYIANFEKHAPELEKALGLQEGAFFDCVPVGLGGKNQTRPLASDGKDIIIGGEHSTVGESVVDVFVKDNEGNPYNLSLKYGGSVTFCNAGVTRLFSKRSFDEYKEKGVYSAETFLGVDGNKLLDLFCIDHNKFGDIFTTYGNKKEKDHVDVTKDLKNSKEFEKFIESVVGYNYVLVHQIGSKIHYIDLRTEQDMKKLIGKVKNAEVWYGGEAGNGKRIDIMVELTNMKVKFNIRNKQGGLYPTHIMADYTIKH